MLPHPGEHQKLITNIPAPFGMATPLHVNQVVFNNLQYKYLNNARHQFRNVGSSKTQK